MHAKTYAIVSIALILLIGMTIAWFVLHDSAADSPQGNFTSAAVVAHLQECADLVTVRAPISTVVEQRDAGRVGGARALLAVTAWLDVGCDLKWAKVISTDSHARIVHLSLPAPKVLAVRLDAERTRVYDLQRSGLWHFIPGTSIELALINTALQSATTSVVDQPTTTSLVRLAQERIRAELQVLASGTGWKVEIDWQP